MPKNVIVVGMPRTGTSLTMGILARKGYYVGPIKRDRYREGDEHNPFGYFEADALVKRNAALFGKAGFPFHNTWLFDPIPDACFAAIRALPAEPIDHELVRSYGNHGRWAWKDPRLSYTLGFWWPLVDPDDTVVLLTRRNPPDVCESFRRMGWPVQPDLEARVTAHFEAAARVIEDLAIPHAVLDYGAYLASPKAVAKTLSDLVGLELTVADLNVRRELDHSRGPRGFRAMAHRQALKLPRPLKRLIRRATPRWALEMVLPEWRHVARSDHERAKRGTPERRR